MANNIVNTGLFFGDGKKKAFCFCRNTPDERIFEIKIDSNFNFNNWNDFERATLEIVKDKIYEKYEDYYYGDSIEIQFFIVE